ncbi:MAG: DUF4625 domain-containing protein [Marinifilaceae bacterium]
MKFLKYALIVLFSAGLMSCGGSSGGDDDKTDVTKPTVNLTTPAEGQEIVAGTILKVSAALSDNVELNEYVVTIAKGTKSVKTVKEFKYDSRSMSGLPTISGKSYDLSFDIEVPQDAEREPYVFTITVSDKTGNETVVKRSITIKA